MRIDPKVIMALIIMLFLLAMIAGMTIAYWQGRYLEQADFARSFCNQFNNVTRINNMLITIVNMQYGTNLSSINPYDDCDKLVG
jgi:ABC-type transporter Mla maintaining outer membrane lipid asymmetry permease subunit MlaE